MQSSVLAIKQRFGIVGDSPLLNLAIQTAYQVAPTDISVLITGESGVGKEIFSQIIHANSNRKHEKFIAVNCGAIPEGTIDSELFGHEKGSFTGAFEARKGYFETVNGGTIFLDEVGEMPLGTQARLLRVLETGEFIKVGASKVLKTDVRVIAATNVKLLDSIAKGKFREDLYYRLNTVNIQIPSLRERSEDIHLLFRKFASDFAERYSTNAVMLDAEAQQLLSQYSWPGNIRQLKNVSEQISVLSPTKLVQGKDILRYLPENNYQSKLPAVLEHSVGATADFSEREILYRLLFDMKNDLNDLKKVVAHLSVQADINQLDDADRQILQNLTAENQSLVANELLQNKRATDGAFTPVVVDQRAVSSPNKVQDIEESFSLEDLEKNMIIKALSKHKGRRKNAAIELGISERTLYRKIKEFNLEY